MNDAVYPALETMPARSRANVRTDRPARYAKQLASHLGRKISVGEIEGGYRLTFNRDGQFGGYGDVLVETVDGVEQLTLKVYAVSEQARPGLEGVLGRHLERFGERDGLTVTFTPEG